MHLRLGAGEFKNRTLLTPRNVLQKCHSYWCFKMQSAPDASNLKAILLRMLQSGHYYPCASFVGPSSSGNGMAVHRALSAWTAMVAPSDVCPEDVDNIFFKTNSRFEAFD